MSELKVSFRAPKSRKFLFPNELASSTPRETEVEDETTQMKRSKRKKLRRTQNFLDFVDETDTEIRAVVSDTPKRRNKTLSAESVNTESLEVFLQSSEKKKSTIKSRKKLMRLPDVVIDDLEYSDNNEEYYEEKMPDKKKKLRKQRSIIDSNSSFTLEVKTDEKERKVKRKKISQDSDDENETRVVKTRSSKKKRNQETYPETNEIANTSRRIKGDGTIKRNKKSKITDSNVNDPTEGSGENNEEEVNMDDAALNAQTSGKKRKNRSKRLNENHDEPLEVVLKTRNSKKRRKERSTNRKSDQKDSENTDQTELHSLDHEVDKELANKDFSSVDENDEMEIPSKKRKRLKKSNPKLDKDRCLTPETRKSRRRKDKKSSEENLKAHNRSNVNNQIDSEENKTSENEREILSPTDEDILSTQKHNSSIEENKEVQTFTKKRKSSKKIKKHDEDETIATKRRSMRHQKGLKSMDDKEGYLQFDHYRNSDKDVSKVILSAVDEDNLLTKMIYSSVDEEMESRTSKRKRKSSKKLHDHEHDENGTMKAQTRNSMGQKELKINDGSGEKEKRKKSSSKQFGNAKEIESYESDILSTVNDNILLTGKHSTSNDEIEIQTSIEKRRRSKRSSHKHGENETLTTRTSRTLSDRKTHSSSEENEKYDDEAENQITDSEENDLSEDEEKISSIDGNVLLTKTSKSSTDDDEIETQTSTEKRRRSKSSSHRHGENETLTTRTSRTLSDRKTNSSSEENEKYDDEAQNQITDSEENDFSEDEKNVLFTKTSKSSTDDDVEMEVEALKEKTEKFKKTNQNHDEDRTLTPKIRSSRGQKDEKTIDNSKEYMKVSGSKDQNEDNEMEVDTSTAKTEKSKKTDDEDRTLTPKIRSSKGQKDQNKDNVIEAAGGKRRSSKKSDRKYEEKSIQPYTRTSEKLQKDGSMQIDNEDKEDIKTEKMLIDDGLCSFRKSGKFFNYESSGKSGESAEDSEILEDVIFSSTQLSSPDNADISRETSGRKRSNLERNEDNVKTPKISIRTASQVEAYLGESFQVESDNKENVKTENESKVENLSICRRSRRNVSSGLIDRTGGVEVNNEINVFTDKRSSTIDKIAEIPIGSNEITSELPIQGRKSSTGRKRWTIIKDKTEPMFDQANETPNLSLSVTSNQKRSVRKRWSTELKKKFESMKEENEPSFVNCGDLEEPAFLKKEDDENEPTDRWTIMKKKSELKAHESNETPNITLNENPNQRRSVRKRWSTELKKKFELMGNGNETSYGNGGVLEEYPFLKKEDDMNEPRESSLNKSSESPVSSRKVDRLDSPMPFNVSAQNSVSQKFDETFTPEKGEHSFFRNSKRLSRSLDFSDGISPLEQTVTLENESSKFPSNELQSSFDRKSQTPGSILKRRGTYDLDVSVTDVSVLRSLSESSLSDPGLLFKQDDSEIVKKNVRFQHVTVRKGCARKNKPDSPENKFEANNTPVTTKKKTASKPTAANKSVSFDQTMFSASSLASSTPLHSLRKNILMKETLKREKLSNIASNRRSRSVETKRDKFVSRIRMPNFTKIHQKAMERVEDVTEMTRRKAERARLLLSGQKPTANTNSAYKTQEKNTNDPKRPKQLKFNKFQPVPSRPKKEETSSLIVNKFPKVTAPTKIDSSKSKIKDVKSQPAAVNKITNLIKKVETAPTKPLFTKSTIADRLRNVKTNPTQHDGALKRAEQIKTIVTKSKPKTDAREERRIVVKGVRGNRRFDLLMQMRNK